MIEMANEPKVICEPTSQRAGSLKSRVIHAGSWALIGHAAGLALRLLGTLVTTRLFAPEIFGILAIATAVNVVIALLTDVGLRQAIIQSPNGGRRSFLDTAWTLQILRGWLIWGVCAGVAVGLHAADVWGWLPTGSVYANPILPAVITAIAFSAIVAGLQSMKAVTVNRDLDLKRVTLIELISQLVGLAAVILVGWVTRSIWAFVVGVLVVNAVFTLLSHVWLHGQTDRLAWDRSALQELTHFGKWIFLSSALGALVLNGDRLLLGGLVNPAMLGYYSIASNLATAAEGAASRLFGSVSLPALSEVVRRQPERLPALSFRMRWATDAVMVGMAGFLFATGEWIIGLLYDARYAPAGPLLQWLSFGLLFARYGFAQSAYLALGRPSYVTAINVVRSVSLFVLVPLLFHAFGMQGAIVAIAFHLMPTVPLVLWFNQRHGLNNVRLEIGVLGMWPLGWLVGLALLAVVRA